MPRTSRLGPSQDRGCPQQKARASQFPAELWSLVARSPCPSIVPLPPLPRQRENQGLRPVSPYSRSAVVHPSGILGGGTSSSVM